jgi:hypothetical protein
MRQFHLHLAASRLAFFRPLALGQIEHESDTLVPTFLEGRRPDQDGARNEQNTCPRMASSVAFLTPQCLQAQELPMWLLWINY